MGRKIPGKKHRGVKDPLQQQAKRQAELENKINAPPKDPVDQPIPKSLERIVKLKDAIKSGKVVRVNRTKRKKRKDALICVGRGNPKPLHPKAKPDKVVPIFEQRPGENEEKFMRRVNRETQAFINETAFENKYGVQVNRNLETGRVEGLSKCDITEFDKIQRVNAKHRNIKKKKKKTTEEPKMTKAEKRKEKLKLKKQKQLEEKIDDFDSFKDQVKFGEVVHEPPQLQVRPRKAETISTSKPGKKELLLHSVLKQNEKTKMDPKKATPIDRRGKRKNLPVGERRQLEKEQSDIIAQYRRLKAQWPTGVNN
ncbi:Coiled-coil domain-containing protein 137 [Habropoda laboriosa]|uniref:Coiled-coil domain-containing protein 137 n=1 Tax=Habropoda laboriosa TaxID=597456 RepID=A0A0L7RF69_9HYME|nr:PREDICTED: coiled-coil domain-containing protein 137 [Habropoda laboriosa]XP_017797815.1 PREDICTED: coiled-coil domain-containing protein 137 [Habropoda laboriosa]KOC69361.1 Coiled-coil domain-containing protein 137 [Habropoda laboriosa]